MSNFDRMRMDLLLKYDLAAFIRRVLETIAPGEIYQHNWQSKRWRGTCKSASRRDHSIDRHGPSAKLKSTCASIALRMDPRARPDCPHICISYSADLAARHHSDSVG